jgi:hypothetical protein
MAIAAPTTTSPQQWCDCCPHRAAVRATTSKPCRPHCCCSSGNTTLLLCSLITHTPTLELTPIWLTSDAAHLRRARLARPAVQISASESAQRAGEAYASLLRAAGNNRPELPISMRPSCSLASAPQPSSSNIQQRPAASNTHEGARSSARAALIVTSPPSSSSSNHSPSSHHSPAHEPATSAAALTGQQWARGGPSHQGRFATTSSGHVSTDDEPPGAAAAAAVPGERFEQRNDAVYAPLQMSSLLLTSASPLSSSSSLSGVASVPPSSALPLLLPAPATSAENDAVSQLRDINRMKDKVNHTSCNACVHSRVGVDSVTATSTCLVCALMLLALSASRRIRVIVLLVTCSIRIVAFAS